jgi:TetR/AcrR family transcriptional repressor of bet genes
MPRVSSKTARKTDLIHAALDSIAKRGLMETTITHIAKGAGMSRGIINFYFTSKEMMQRETLKFLIDAYEAIWESALQEAGEDGHRRLAALVQVHFDKRLCSPRRLNVMSAFWGHAATQASYRNQLEAADHKLETALTEALAHLNHSSLEEARRHARQLHALIRGLWLAFMLNPQAVSREALAAECFSFVDRLSGAPVRVIAPASLRVVTAEKPAKPKAAKKASPKAAKHQQDAPVQMDIEDLFAVRR